MAYPDQAQAIRELLASDGPTVAKNTRGFNDGRYASVARLEDYDELKRRARAIKEDAIERLPELIDQVRAAVEARGGAVYVADDAAAANRYIAQVTEGARRRFRIWAYPTSLFGLEFCRACGHEGSPPIFYPTRRIPLSCSVGYEPVSFF
jgi:hypothetical protein